MAESEGLLAWRRKQKKGAIMKASTFERIVREKMAEGMSEDRARRVAGAAYWNTAESKYSGLHKRLKKHKK